MTGFRRAAVVFTLTVAALGGAARVNPLPPGLRGEYFANPRWEAPRAVTRFDSRLSTRTLLAAWSGSPPDAFSATWTGAILVWTPGSYTFATRSDDGSALWIDGRLVVDNRGRHAAQTAEGTIRLARGSHRVLALYEQDGRDLELEVLWARGGPPLRPIPPWALWPHEVDGFVRPALSYLVDSAFAFLKWIWLALAVMTLAAMAASRLRAALQRAGLWRELRWILAASFVLNAAGLWWGLPGHWVAIETLPLHVLYGLSRYFSNGWFEIYPPLHYYVLAAASSPLLAMQSHGYFTVRGAFGEGSLLAIYRTVSLVAAAGTVVATSVCAAEVFGKRAGLFAAGIVALTVPFVYYAKTANVDMPYLFWYALSLVFYVRILRDFRLSDFVLFAAAATCAVCTKDQAYALYLLAPPVIVYELARANHEAGRSRPFWRALVDRRLLAAAGTAIVVFCVLYQLPFNYNGFVNHVRSITSGAAAYRVFEPTFDGRVALLQLTVRLVIVSLSWPFFVAAVYGVAIGSIRRPLRRVTLWLLVALPSYYLGLINVVLYNYDRFVLPICVILAMFGGLALDSFLAGGSPRRRWRSVAVAALFAYAVLYAGSVDVLMIQDSRYAVARWMAAHIGRNDIVGVTGLHEYLPRLEGYRTIDLTTIEELRRERPRYFVLNADYSRAVPADTPWGQLSSGLHNGTLGYRLTFRFRHPPPWPWLAGSHPDLVGPRLDPLVFSVLRNVNPEIEIFEREPAPDADDRTP